MAKLPPPKKKPPKRPPPLKEPAWLKDHPSSVTCRALLEVAVPLWIMKIQREAWSSDRLVERAGVCGQHVAEHGDVLQFGGGKKGQAAEAFNRLAEGLACLAFVPGGVVFLGQRWEVKP